MYYIWLKIFALTLKVCDSGHSVWRSARVCIPGKIDSRAIRPSVWGSRAPARSCAPVDSLTH